LFDNRWLPQSTRARCAGSSGDFLPPSPPSEKSAARQDQARQSGTNDGTGNKLKLTSNLAGRKLRSVNIKMQDIFMWAVGKFTARPGVEAR